MSAASDERYRAPALEKGLHVLELLSGETEPLAFSIIAERLGRSKSELFRVLQVLEREGYIARNADAAGYVLTNKLFMLGLAQPRQATLIEAATPRMRRLSEVLEQSCHLAVLSGDDMVVIHRIEGAGALGFSVRVGYRRGALEATSGLVLLAFQPAELFDGLIDRLASGVSATKKRTLTARIGAIRADGFAREPSANVEGITDLSVPVRGRDGVAAALTIPFVHKTPARHTEAEALDLLSQAAEQVSREIG